MQTLARCVWRKKTFYPVTELSGNCLLIIFGSYRKTHKTLPGKGYTGKRESALLLDYREAELKHGRLTMPSAIAYLTQETLHPKLATALHMPNELANSLLSPSIVDGNLNAPTLVTLLPLAFGFDICKTNRIGTSCRLRVAAWG